MAITQSRESSSEPVNATRKILFLVSSAEIGFWLAELTRPFWHFTEAGAKITIASPTGSVVRPEPASDPYTAESWEKSDLVSIGFLTVAALRARLANAVRLDDIDPDRFDALHVVGGGGAAVDLYPNSEVGRLIEHFFAKDRVVGAIGHGSIALANVPQRVRGRSATGFSRAEDAQVEALYGFNFIPNFPQPVMQAAGIKFSCIEPWGIHVIVDGKLITGQNQQSASEYAIAFNHLIAGRSPVAHS